MLGLKYKKISLVFLIQMKSLEFAFEIKVEKISEDSLDLIPLTSLSVKIQIIGGEVYLM